MQKAGAGQATKKSEPQLDYIVEEDDFFGSFIQKRIRKFNKKLKEIEDLEKKEKLEEAQQQKVSTKNEQLQGIEHSKELLNYYIQAYADARAEGKEEIRVNVTAGKKAAKKEAKAKEKASQPAPQPKVESPEPVAAAPPQPAPQISEEEIAAQVTTKLRQVLNLVHFAQFFADPARHEEFRSQTGQNIADSETFLEFYLKVFTYTEASLLDRNEDKIEQSLDEIEKYLAGEGKPALRNRTYQHLLETVERVVNSVEFREKTAQVQERRPVRTTDQNKQGAIGSEIKNVGTQQSRIEQHVIHSPQLEEEHAPVHQSPAKQPAAGQEQEQHGQEQQGRQAEERHVHFDATAEEQKGRKHWAEIDDHEEEEEGGAGEQENKEDDDGFVLVAKKRSSGVNSQRRPGRGGPRRGGRGGEAGGPRGERGPRPPREQGEGGDRPRGGFRGRGGPRGGEGEEGGERRGNRGGFRREEGGEEGGERRGNRGGYRREEGGDFGERRGGGNRGYRGEGGDEFRSSRGGRGKVVYEPRAEGQQNQ